MPSNAMRNVWLNERDKQLREYGEYGIVYQDSWEAAPTDQNLTTSYVTVTGSSRSYTPKYSDSIITYEFSAMVSYVDSSGISHWRVQHNGVDDRQWDVTHGGTTFQGRVHMVWRGPSWTGARTTLLRVREYGGSNEMQVGYTNHWDGTGTDNDTRMWGRITEWRAPPQNIIDLGID
jgi:hypothetical protein